jgi:hypothetical protein
VQALSELRTDGRRRTAAAASLVFAALFSVYVLNGDFLPCSDATATTYLPVHLIAGEGLIFTPDNAPFMFDLDPSGGPAQKRGSYIVPTTSGAWANTFGFGTAVTALPAFVVSRLIWGPELSGRHDVIWMTAKVAAAAMVAGSGVFVFLAARRFTTLRRALLVCAVYGLGTCVWTLSSQALWQHPANALFVSLGAWLFVRGFRRGEDALPHWGWMAGAGLAWSWAVACRPTSVLLIAVGAAGLLWLQRRSLLAFVGAAVPVGVLLAVHNALLFGSPLRFGQTVHTATATEYLARKGVDSPWTLAVWEGAAGLLLSPSRGLLVYSPFLIFALLGMVRTFREPTWRALRPLVVATLVLWLVAFAWFDWWGGWSFGYRPIVDTAPLLVLFLVPVLPAILSAPSRRIAFALTVAWAVGVQALGAFAYNARGWNHKVVFELVMPDGSAVVTADFDEVDRLATAGGERARAAALNVDLPEYRYRLWSVADSQILYYAGSVQRSRADKKRDQAAWLRQFVDAP